MSDEPRHSLEELRNIDVEVVSLPVEQLEPDPDNPNEMTPEAQEALGEAIDRGFVQPVYVRRRGDGYRIVDGEHRWREVTARGYATVPCVIERDDITDDEARLRLLEMNSLRGTLVPIRLARMLVNLAERIPEAEIQRRLGMEEAEFRDALRLADLDLDAAGDAIREQLDRENKTAPVKLTFVLGARDAAAVEKVIEKALAADENLDRGKLLVKMAREWQV